MDIFQTFTSENRSVTPVIGAILITAITIILAAVIGTFALGYTDSISGQTVQADFSFKFADDGIYDPSNVPDYLIARPEGNFIADNVTITHNGGDDIPSDQLAIKTYGDGIKYIDENGDLQDGESGGYQPTLTFEEMDIDSPVSSGDSVTITTIQQDADDEAGRDVTMLDSQSLYVVFTPESGESSVTVAKWEGPNE